MNYLFIIIVIVLILSLLYITYVFSQRMLLSNIQRFFNDVNLVEGKDIIFNNDKTSILIDAFNRGNLGFGESYMVGDWDSPDLYNLYLKIIENGKYFNNEYSNKIIKLITKIFFSNPQTSGLEMINKHYNLGNDFFSSWLDENMQYSCGYWKDADNLNQAQINKMNLIGRKLKLQKGMKVLDIGFGWGTLSNYLSKTFDVDVVGIKLSSEQYNYAVEHFKNNPKVKYIYGDFSDILKYNIKFDRIVSVGFYEHLDIDRYNDYFNVMQQCLKDDGICLLHTIGTVNDSSGIDEWIKKYIFTRGRIPNFCNISSHAQKYDFVIEDWHNFGLDYAKTLLAWYDRFNESYKDKNSIFYRMWKFYLLVCAAGFQSQYLYLWQIIMTKRINKINYTGER